jgi:hypothetical protein
MSKRPYENEMDLAQFGPAMQALPNDRWRRFVIAMCEQGKLSYQAAAMTADPEGWGQNPSAAKQAGHDIAHDERTQAAIREEGQRRLGTGVALATATLLQFIEKDMLAPRDRMMAIKMLLNRSGLPETTEHKVTHAKELSEAEKMDQIVDLAKKLGVDPQTLLGNYKGPSTEGKPAVQLSAPEEWDL